MVGRAAAPAHCSATKGAMGSHPTLNPRLKAPTTGGEAAHYPLRAPRAPTKGYTGGRAGSMRCERVRHTTARAQNGNATCLTAVCRPSPPNSHPPFPHDSLCALG